MSRHLFTFREDILLDIDIVDEIPVISVRKCRGAFKALEPPRPPPRPRPYESPNRLSFGSYASEQLVGLSDNRLIGVSPNQAIKVTGRNLQIGCGVLYRSIQKC